MSADPTPTSRAAEAHPDRLHESGSEPFDACPDGGRCWHGCPGATGDGKKGMPCWRVLNAGPVGDYPGHRWPDGVRRQHGASGLLREQEPAQGGLTERLARLLYEMNGRQWYGRDLGDWDDPDSRIWRNEHERDRWLRQAVVAVREVAPLIAARGGTAAAGGPGSFWTQAEWAEWSNDLARILPDDDVSRYANPEGAQESIIEACLRAYVTERGTAAAGDEGLRARERADLIAGEVWRWLNRNSAPWSPSDTTVDDLAWRALTALDATPAPTEDPAPVQDTLRAAEYAIHEAVCTAYTHEGRNALCHRAARAALTATTDGGEGR